MFVSSSNRIRVMIPKYSNIVLQDKTYAVYCMEVIYNGNVTTLEKRYSEYYDLYRKLQKIFPTKIPFPAKHVLNRDSKVLESRRIGIEFYLQEFLRQVQEDVPEKLLEFLEIKNYGDDELDDLDGQYSEDEYKVGISNETKHQSLFCFEKDAFLHPSAKEIEEEKHLPDIIIKGCLDGLYS